MSSIQARRIDPYSLHLFVAVAELGSIAWAAEAEHIAASALSRRIADLEQALGAPLIVRSPRGIALTEAGRMVLDRGAQLEAHLGALARDVRAISGTVAGTLRVLANPSSIVGYLPEGLRAFRERYPETVVELKECSSHKVVRGCLDDEADIGVGEGLDTPPGIESWFFREDPYIVVLPRDHSKADRGGLAFAEVVEDPLISIQAGGSLDRHLRSRAASASLALDIGIVVNSFDAVCRMVEAGLGIAVLPRSAASAYAGSEKFALLELRESWAHRELRLYALRKTPRPASALGFVETLGGVASNAMPPNPT